MSGFASTGNCSQPPDESRITAFQGALVAAESDAAARTGGAGPSCPLGALAAALDDCPHSGNHALGRVAQLVVRRRPTNELAHPLQLGVVIGQLGDVGG